VSDGKRERRREGGEVMIIMIAGWDGMSDGIDELMR
jgi:hypothetical protein